jgi:tetratricopeptide (TPR) repeat protein
LIFTDCYKITYERYRKAKDDCSKAIEFNPKLAKAYSSRGNLYGELGQYQKAIDDYNKAIKLDPKNAMAYYERRGNLYGNLGQTQKAIGDFSQVIKLITIARQFTSSLSSGRRQLMITVRQ